MHKMPELPLMQTFYDELFHVTLDLPAGWNVGITDEFPLLLVGPVHNDSPDATLGIARSILEPSTNDQFEILIEDTKSKQPDVYANYQHIYDINWLQDSYPAYLQRFEWHDDANGHHFAQIMSMIWAGADVLYDIHGTTPIHHAEQYIPILEHIIRSLEFYAEMP